MNALAGRGLSESASYGKTSQRTLSAVGFGATGAWVRPSCSYHLLFWMEGGRWQ